MSLAIYYLKLLPAIREAAAKWNYAIGLHGSMTRDFDLIAVPWLTEAGSAAQVVEEIRAAVSGHIAERSDGEPWPRKKPHGRLAWSIQVGGGGAYLDLSVMPRISLPPASG